MRRPLWSHLLGFASVVVFYGLIGSDGGPRLGGRVNEIGIALCVLSMALRLAARAGRGPVRYPEITTRLLFFAALPLAVGSFRSWLGLTVPPPGDRAPHMLGLELPPGAARRAAAALEERGVVVSRRGASLRISPHLHNNQEDVDRLMDAVGSAVS